MTALTPETVQTMAEVIELLDHVTGRRWTWEMTGGGCMAIVLYPESGYYPHVMVTAGNGPLSEGDTVAEVLADGEGWMIGYYPDEDHDPEYLDGGSTTEDMLVECMAAAQRVFGR